MSDLLKDAQQDLGQFLKNRTSKNSKIPDKLRQSIATLSQTIPLSTLIEEFPGISRTAIREIVKKGNLIHSKKSVETHSLDIPKFVAFPPVNALGNGQQCKMEIELGNGIIVRVFV